MRSVHILDRWWANDVPHYQDSDNNTILTLLADFKPPATTPYRSAPNDLYASEAALRMAKLYYDRYPYIRDWANSQGKTALHAASMRGSEEVVRVRNCSSKRGNSPRKCCSGDSDRVHFIDRCCVISVRTLT